MLCSHSSLAGRCHGLMLFCSHVSASKFRYYLPTEAPQKPKVYCASKGQRLFQTLSSVHDCFLPPSADKMFNECQPMLILYAFLAKFTRQYFDRAHPQRSIHHSLQVVSKKTTTKVVPHKLLQGHLICSQQMRSSNTVFKMSSATTVKRTKYQLRKLQQPEDVCHWVN